MAGGNYVRWTAVCKHLGIDPLKVCGPVAMAAGKWPEANCCYHHPEGSALHKRPIVKGRPFALADYREELVRLGLTVHQPELLAMCKAGKKPAGAPRKIGNGLVYPKPHFG